MYVPLTALKCLIFVLFPGRRVFRAPQGWHPRETEAHTAGTAPGPGDRCAERGDHASVTERRPHPSSRPASIAPESQYENT